MNHSDDMQFQCSAADGIHEKSPVHIENVDLEGVKLLMGYETLVW